MNADSTQRRALVDTVAATVVAAMLWLVLSMVVHAGWVILERLRGLDKIWLQAAVREVACPIIATYVGMRSGKRWFPGARISVLYYSFAALVATFMIIIPSALTMLSAELAPKDSTQHFLELLVGVVSIIAGLFVAEQLRREENECPNSESCVTRSRHTTPIEQARD